MNILLQRPPARLRDRWLRFTAIFAAHSRRPPESPPPQSQPAFPARPDRSPAPSSTPDVSARKIPRVPVQFSPNPQYSPRRSAFAPRLKASLPPSPAPTRYCGSSARFAHRGLPPNNFPASIRSRRARHVHIRSHSHCPRVTNNRLPRRPRRDIFPFHFTLPRFRLRRMLSPKEYHARLSFSGPGNICRNCAGQIFPNSLSCVFSQPEEKTRT